jgi:hypothetical protein
MSTNVSFAIRTGPKIGKEGVDIRIITGYATCIEPTTLISEGGQKQTYAPFRLSMKTAHEPANFDLNSDLVQADRSLNHTKINKKRKCMASDNTRSTDLLKSLKMRRVDWRYFATVYFCFDAFNVRYTERIYRRWAVEKGFLDKNTHEWNEERGGLEGYLEERNQRMLLRCTFNRGRCRATHFLRHQNLYSLITLRSPSYRPFIDFLPFQIQTPASVQIIPSSSIPRRIPCDVTQETPSRVHALARPTAPLTRKYLPGFFPPRAPPRRHVRANQARELRSNRGAAGLRDGGYGARPGPIGIGAGWQVREACRRARPSRPRALDGRRCGPPTPPLSPSTLVPSRVPPFPPPPSLPAPRVRSGPLRGVRGMA